MARLGAAPQIVGPTTTIDTVTHVAELPSAAALWVAAFSSDTDIPGRLGDARELANRCSLRIGVLCFDLSGAVTLALAQSWIEHGADEVHILQLPAANQSAEVDAAFDFWREHPPRLVLASADRTGRAWAARLAARAGWPLVSPALLVQTNGNQFMVTRLDSSGSRAQQVALPTESPAIVAIRPGVAQPLAPYAARQGVVLRSEITASVSNRIESCERLPPDPRRADIRHLPKLIAGGKGVGGRAGFDVLRRVAEKLGAGIAASRMAVDLGWIEHERQVGQTGKSVRPELYIACGISGASHHLEGMSESRHVVAIDTNSHSPLMQRADLALQGDLHQVLHELDRLLEPAT